MKKILFIFELIFVMLLSVACTEQSSKNIVRVYDVTEKMELKARDIDVESNNSHEIIDEIKSALIDNSHLKESQKNYYNDKIKIEKVELNNNVLIVSIKGDYYGLTSSERLCIRAGIVKTYSSFEFVKNIKFLVNGKAMLDEYGKQLGPIDTDNIVTMLGEEKPKNMRECKIYFANKDNSKLVAQRLLIDNQSSALLAKELIKELIRGPRVSGLIRTVPKSTKLKELEIKDGICYIDFNKNFKIKYDSGTLKETFTIYSIVNTLTEFPEIERVQFLIDGEKIEEYQGKYEFNMPFTRNESLIAQ